MLRTAPHTVSCCLIQLSCGSPDRLVSKMLSSSHFFGNARGVRLLALLFVGIFLVTATGCRKDHEFDEDRPAGELYAAAKQSMDNKSWDRAIQLYKILQTRYPFGRYTEQSMLDLSYCYYKAHERQNALSGLNRFIRTYPTHPNVDYAYYLKGLVNFDENLGFLERMMPSRVRDRDQSAARDAFIDFSELIRRYPDSRYNADARQRMVFLRNNLAAYEVGVANYYLRRKAYVAAASRARYSLETYPNTPETSEALVTLHQAYTALSLTELANSTMEVLELNYPDNYYVLGEKKKKNWMDWLWPFD